MSACASILAARSVRRSGAPGPAPTMCTTPFTRPVIFASLLMLPPPAAGADVLARFDRTGARRTADAWISAGVEWIDRHIMAREIAPHFLVAPGGKRIEFWQGVFSVELLDGDVAPGDRLRTPLSGDPGASPGKRERERCRFANRATTSAQLDAAVKAVHTIRQDEILERMGIGVVHFDGNSVTRAHAVYQGVGLLRKPPGIEGEDGNWQREPRDQVGEDHILGAEAAREGCRRVTRRHPLQQVDGLGEVAFAIHGSLAAAAGARSGPAARRRNKGMGSRTVA